MELGDSDCDYPLKELEQVAQGEHEEDNKGNEDNNASDKTEICQTPNASRETESQPSTVETTLMMLQSAINSQSLSTVTQPLSSTISKTPITTFADLLYELHQQYSQLPPVRFLDLFLEFQAIVGELYHQEAGPLMQIG
ncbi:hypothetical protein BDV09DRAFT_200699 [Aspergillus tetrazonus]